MNKNEKKKKLLLTGFGPFNGLSENASEGLVQELSDLNFANIDLFTHVFECNSKNLKNDAQKVVKRYDPDVIISLGVAMKREHFSVERVAINVLDFRISDVVGNQPRGERILPSMPDGIFSNLPIHAVTKRLREFDPGSYISNSAGTFLCNQLMFLNLSHAKEIKSGFIHIPPFTCISKNVQVKALLSLISLFSSLQNLQSLQSDDPLLIDSGTEE